MEKCSVQQAIQEKQASHRQWMASFYRGNPELAKQNYRKATGKVKRMVRKCKRQFESSIAEKAKTNPKPFWSHFRGRLKTKEGVAPLLSNPNDKSSMKFTDKEKANILLQQFSSCPEDNTGDRRNGGYGDQSYEHQQILRSR